MKKLIAALAMGASVVAPQAALAATSGLLEAEMIVPYACSVTVPTRQTLIPTGNSATVSANWGYDQNGDTEYVLTALQLSGPTGATLGGSIRLDKDGSQLLSADGIYSDPNRDSFNTITGVDASASENVTFTLNETVYTGFQQGSYLMATTLSCSEDLGGGL